jgi:5-methylcytosine-specific restriction endonuclease McrA
MKTGNIGQRLKHEWNVHAKHALYSKSGRTYDHLKDFPGALFDDDGYVVFNTEQDYEKYKKNGHLHIRKKVSIPRGIRQIPIYKKKPVAAGNLPRLNTILQKFENDLANALRDPSKKRQERLASAKKKPARKEVTTSVFLRNPDVIAEVMHRAGQKCEQCKKKAPFKRRTDGTPYLEVHHRITLADGGEDTVQNAIALCPNCHRKAHFG